MISSKKSYAEQLLQLALALSLLQVDPENVLGRGWDSQLEYRHGNGWELEMLRAVPMTEYPYANRKAMMPLIEDLVRFDRQINNFGDVTAYLLNVQGGQCNQSLTTSDIENNSNLGAVALDPTLNSNHSTASGAEIDLFLNSQHFEDQVSILDQNLADLTDFGDFANSLNPYYGLTMKEEPQDNSFHVDFEIKQENDTANTSDFGSMGRLTPPETNITFGSVPWQDVLNSTKEEPKETNDSRADEYLVKSEPASDDEESVADCNTEHDSGNGPLLNSSEVTEEESEIVEVLWKQDVDLGYSLSPSKLATGTSEINSSKSSADDVEKLKALEELKLETPKDELDDEWAGIPFTIDNETGEYIRLPLQLDELLQDVLQLAELSTTDNQETLSDPIASTSSQSLNHKAATKSEHFEDHDANDLDAQCDIEISSLFDLENATSTSELSELSELDELDMMIQSASPYHQHHRNGQNYGGTNSAFRQSTGYHQSRVPPLSRGVSMEQRLQDIANLFNPIPGMGVGMGVGEMSPYSHYPTPYPYQGAHGMPQHSQFTHPSQHPVLHNTSLADLGTPQPHYGHNLGSAVTSSMHLTNSSHENDSGATGYKMEHENMMFYSNSTSELNHTTDGFINSILNDEDLHLMDMNVNEGFCSMRMLDANNTSNNSSVLGSVTGGAVNGHAASNLHMSLQNTGASSVANGGVMGADGVVTTAVGGGDRLDASSDSAVSSMGSERVSSLSDVEWGEGSDSAQDYHQGKYGGPYDYSYNSRLNDGSRQAPVAQKKHHMFGKRYFQEPSHMQANLTPSVNPPHAASQLATPIKYEYEPYGNVHPGSSIGHNMEGAVGPAINKDHIMSGTDPKYGGYSLDYSARPPRNPHEIINHNHTYSLPQGTGSNPRPQLRDKRSKKAEDEHLTRDEKRARSLNVPITVSDIINLPMDEFNERLSKYDLTENQLSLIRDIRRRGKNKVAAQNCRKRKLDQILSLEDEVKEVRKRKEQLYHERDVIVTERRRITNKFATLHRHIFQYLRDSDGNLCSPNEYSLQQAADGSVYLLRKDTHKSDTSNTNNTNGNSTVPTNNNVQNQHQHHHHQQPHHSHSQQGPPSSTTHRHHHPNHHHHHHHHHKE